MSPDSLIQVLLADNPSPMTGRGTNTYVVGQDDVVVIDPGPDDKMHLDRVESTVRQRGRASAVLLTHHHLDHSESAAQFATRLGIPLAGGPHPPMPPPGRPPVARAGLPLCGAAPCRGGTPAT